MVDDWPKVLLSSTWGLHHLFLKIAVAKQNDDVIDQVAQAIEYANTRNRRQERFEIALLTIFFLGGMSLLILGAIYERWPLLVPGSIVQLATVWPLRQIAKIRADKTRLQVVLQLLKLSTSKESKALAAMLVKRLIEKV